ncbi:carboxypeptidase-like regulatory domain-containing protein [Sutcliffiella cohnii]|uniref:carboxypeptidase-like regulatory domain-containing protein n=1 Tax=Sutcliffiella cohnii TaxID=33932 RepID=UPI002E1AF3AF|nr:carboxypeptidase-like regulatory domain-containing protein [Sutcliffiella cohnii]
MKIKLKVKHLLITIVGLLTVTPLLFILIKPQIEYAITDYKIRNGKPVEKSQVVYLLDEAKILKGSKLALIRNYVMEYSNAGYDVLVGPHMYQVKYGFEGEKLSEEERLHYLQFYLEKAPIDGYYTEAAKLAIQYYIKVGNEKKSEQLIKDTLNKVSENYYLDEVYLEQLKWYVTFRPLDEVEHFIKLLEGKIETNNYMLGEMAKLEAKAIIAEGKYEVALSKLSDRIRQSDKMVAELEEDIEEGFEAYNPGDELRTLEASLKKSFNNGELVVGSIAGRIVRSDGSPVVGAVVMLRTEHNAGYGMRFEDELYQVYTDDEGHYQFPQVMPGRYQVFLGLQLEQVDGWAVGNRKETWVHVKNGEHTSYDIALNRLIEVQSPINDEKITADEITFRWNKVEGADYYQLNIGYSFDEGSIMSGSLKGNIQGETITISTEELYNRTMGIYYEDPDHPADPRSILALSNPNIRILWSVDAFREDGEFITRSSGYRLDEERIGNLPFFYLQERELTEADELLLDSKWEEAYEAYEKSYASNPDDLHSLRMLYRLADLKKEGKYLIELAEKTKDPHIIFEVVRQYYRVGNWGEYMKWYEKYEAVSNGEEDAFELSIHGTVLMTLGKYEEARSVFQEAMNKDNYNMYVGNWIALELLENNQFAKALEVAKNYPEENIYETSTDWESLLKDMQQESKGKEQYVQTLQEVIQFVLENDEKSLSEWRQSTDYQEMRKYIYQLGELYINKKR